MKIKKEVVGEESSNYLLLSLTKQGIIPRDMDNPEGKFPASFETYQIVNPGDLIFCLFDIDETPRSVGLSKYNGMITGAYTRFLCIPKSAVYIYYYYLAMDNGKYLKPLYTGLRKVIQKSTFLSAKMPFPPQSEQETIVNYLEYMSNIIIKFIHLKKIQIKLIKEQKQLIIHRAVTGQIDVRTGKTYPEYKPSGVEWLGDVPEHWGISQVRSIAQVVRGGTPRPAGSSLYFHGDAEPWITVGELTKDSDVYLYSTATRLTALGVERSRIVLPGTLLLTNSGATLGVPKITKIQGCINDGVAAFLRVRSTAVKEFLYFYWITQTPHLRAWVNLGAQPNLNTQIIGGWPVVLPPLSEQQDIVDWINNQTLENIRAFNELQKEIELLHEFRIRLITDVVTGKLDVRDVKLPKLKVSEDDIEPEDEFGVEEGIEYEDN